MNNRRFAWTARGLVALLVGVAMLGLAVLNVAAQDATPITDVTPGPETTATSVITVTPESTQTTSSEAGEVLSEPNASPEVGAQEAQLDVLQATAAEGTGSLSLSVVDGNNNSILGVCFNVFVNIGGHQGNHVANACDSTDGTDDGVTSIMDIPVGNYLVAVTWVPEGYALGGSNAVEIGVGETIHLTFTLESGGRTLLIRKVDENGTPLPGACFNLTVNSGTGQPGDFVSSNCSNPSTNDGFVYIMGIVPGSYVLYETQAPPGYVGGQAVPIVIEAGQGTIERTVVNDPIASPGNLVINKVDENDQPLTQACFNVFVNIGGGQQGAFVASGCDWQDGTNNGTTVLTGLQPGSYVVVETLAPPGYVVGANKTVTLVAGEPAELTVQNSRGGATLTVLKIDESGAPLLNSCFGVNRVFGGGGSEFVTGTCDDQGPGTIDGTIVFSGLPPGSYVLFESQVPTGYVQAANVPFVVDASANDVTLAVQNTPIDAVGNLIVHKVDGSSSVLVGACFVAFVDTGGGMPGEYVNGACDWDDGANNGDTIITGLLAGNYVVRETLAPQGYRLGEERLVTIPAEGVGAEELTVENVLGGASVTVESTDESGVLLSGACFAIYYDNGSGVLEPGTFLTQGCGDSIMFTGLPAGDYILSEYQTPSGYHTADLVLFSLDGSTGKTITVQHVQMTLVEQIVEILVRILQDILAEQ